MPPDMTAGAAAPAAAPAAAAALPPMPWALLAAACLGMFAASCSGTTRAPFLLDMARDLATSLPLVANLMAMTSIAWGAASMVAGAGSDRWGRRPFLVGGPVALALCMVGAAVSQTFLGVAVWATLAGGCAGAFTGVLMAEASARVADRQRGRALGWVMAGQSLTLLAGVPLAAWIGASVGWRGVHLCVAGVALAAALGLLVTTLRPVDGPRAAGAARPSYRAAMSGRVVRLLAMGVAERVCYGLTAVFFATFLQATYGLSLAEVAAPLAVFALGSILGTIAGGQLADRLPNRLLTFAGAMFGSAGVALALFGWTGGGLAGSVALGFGYVLVNAVARPSLMAALGGWIMAQYGFAGFGPLAAGVAVLGGALALLGRR